jgi:hypothetical protein
VLMSELVERHQDLGGEGGHLLLEALLKTGPIIHRGLYTYSATAGRRGTTLTKAIRKSARGARDSTTVGVPTGGYRSKSQCLIDRFEGYARMLKSGIATAESRDDMESLANNLDDLAGEIRGWSAPSDVEAPSYISTMSPRCRAGRFGRRPQQ